MSGTEPYSTNNRMELTGSITGLRALKDPCDVTAYTDSKYVSDAFNKGWLRNWQRNGWRTAAGKSVKNPDLWREMIELTEKHDVKWVWVKGHASNVENNRCDQLAVDARLSGAGVDTGWVFEYEPS